MNCVIYGHQDSWKKVHAHLVEAHLELVELKDDSGRLFYIVNCPLCDWHLIKR